MSEDTKKQDELIAYLTRRVFELEKRVKMMEVTLSWAFFDADQTEQVYTYQGGSDDRNDKEFP